MDTAKPVTGIYEVPAYRAHCHECWWKGPYRATEYDARPDLDRHLERPHVPASASPS